MIALVDANNFYVSCERVFDPRLEGKAVAVLSNNDGCVISRSPECKALGVEEDAISSPTFAIVNEYRGRGGRPIFHFDFYRIEQPAEALDIGLFDYLDSGELCLMEWPENVEALLPEETLQVHIEVAPDGTRTLSWED